MLESRTQNASFKCVLPATKIHYRYIHIYAKRGSSSSSRNRVFTKNKCHFVWKFKVCLVFRINTQAVLIFPYRVVEFLESAELPKHIAGKWLKTPQLYAYYRRFECCRRLKLSFLLQFCSAELRPIWMGYVIVVPVWLGYQTRLIGAIPEP